MSEIINNKQMRIETMKNLVRQLHENRNDLEIRDELARVLDKVEYNDVFLMENQLIAEGISAESIRELCDIHTKVLRPMLDLQLPIETIVGHPLHSLFQENKAIENLVAKIRNFADNIIESNNDYHTKLKTIHSALNELMDIDKHYQKKENLIFPFFEAKNFTGPSKVMWSKDDEVRDFLKGAIEGLHLVDKDDYDQVRSLIGLSIIPTLDAISEMIYKEEKIFLPMSKDLLTEQDWYEVHVQTPEIGYCLYVPEKEWLPSGGKHLTIDEVAASNGKIKMPSGTFELKELISTLNTLPFDLTFVDKDDVVRYFSEGSDRIFTRTKTILGRKVQNCHPPDSVHIVNQIIDDFRTGKQNLAKFWINFLGKFVYILYYAVRDDEGNYLGTLEVTQDLTDIMKLEGERRLLSYE